MKSTGYDNIPARFLKDGSAAIASPVTYIMNLSLRKNYVPRDFKVARVVPLYKKGDKNFEGNYRPVSVLPVISKILERIVFNQFYSYLSENSLIYMYQSGFRERFSTDTALTYLVDKIKCNTDNGLYTGMVLLDLQKAFDTVDHEILLGKLGAIGANSQTVNWFNSYLTSRSQYVQVSDVSSNQRDVLCGVPQGSIIGPLLFIVYVNDMSNAVKCDLYLYADDSALIISGKSLTEIEKLLSDNMSLVSQWLIDNKLSLHLGKTESILFASKRKSKDKIKLQVTCNETKIECKENVKYLGMVLENNLSGSMTVRKVIKKVNNGLRFLYRKKDLLKFQERKMICGALFQSHFDYASSLV